MIDLALLDQVANRPGQTEVVTTAWLRQALSELGEGKVVVDRAWLRQIHGELEAARAPQVTEARKDRS